MLILSTSARWLVTASDRDDVPELLDLLGIADGGDPAKVVDATLLYDVVEKIEAEGKGDLAVRAAESLTIDSYGPLGLVFKTSASVGAGLSRLERYGSLVSDAIQYQLNVGPEEAVRFVISGRAPSTPATAVVNEAALAGVVAFCRQAVAPTLLRPPVSVSFRHRPRSSAPSLERFFRCPVIFEASFDGLVLNEAFLETPIRLADEALNAFLGRGLDDKLRSVAGTTTIKTAVRAEVARHLPDGVPPMRSIAQSLHTSERTLRRQLAEAGTRYADLVTGVQRSTAENLLTETDLDLVDIAFLTGFSDQSAFHRAFKRWTGLTPKEMRSDQSP